jgi:hypothetical protein
MELLDLYPENEIDIARPETPGDLDSLRHRIEAPGNRHRRLAPDEISPGPSKRNRRRSIDRQILPGFHATVLQFSVRRIEFDKSGAFSLRESHE